MSRFALRDGNIGLWVVVGALLTTAKTSANRKTACRISRDSVKDRDVAMVLGEGALSTRDAAFDSAADPLLSTVSQPVAAAPKAINPTMTARLDRAVGSQTTALSLLDDESVLCLSRLLLNSVHKKRSVPLN